MNNGANYSGTTVFLGSDIEFTQGLSGSFKPIGYMNENKCFNGVFNGQGHMIKNIKFTWSDMWSFSFPIFPSSLFTYVVC